MEKPTFCKEMSQDIEAGKCLIVEEEIPLVGFVDASCRDSDLHTDYCLDDEKDPTPSSIHPRYVEASNYPNEFEPPITAVNETRNNNREWGNDWFFEQEVAPMEQSQSSYSSDLKRKQYKLDIFEGFDKSDDIDDWDSSCPRDIFKFMKLKPNTNMDQIVSQVEEALKSIGANISSDEILVSIDESDHIPSCSFDFLSKIALELGGKVTFLCNGLLTSRIKDNGNQTQIAAILSTSQVLGSAASVSECGRVYSGFYEYEQNGESNQHLLDHSARLGLVLLLENATSYDVLKYKLGFQKSWFNMGQYCMRYLMNCSKEVLKLIDNGLYFGDNTGTFVAKNDGLLSSTLCSFIEHYRNQSIMLKEAENALSQVCGNILGENDEFIATETVNIIKQNESMIATYDDSKDHLMDSVASAMNKSMALKCNLMMDSAKEIIDEIMTLGYFHQKEEILVFKSVGGLPSLLAKYIESGCSKEDVKTLLNDVGKSLKLYVYGNSPFLEIIDQNKSKLKIVDAYQSDSGTKRLLQKAKESVTQYLAKNFSPNAEGSNPNKSYFTLKQVRTALQDNNPQRFKDLLKWKMEVDGYIFFNLEGHWEPCCRDEQIENRVIKYFSIFSKCPCSKKASKCHLMNTNINRAISTLSSGIMPDCFNLDGTPKVEIISPIQALIINRIFHLQFDFVKMLWKYDQGNLLANAIMIWILVDGILKKGIFARETFCSELQLVKDYFADAIKSSLDSIPICDVDALRCEVAVFRGKPLYHAAGVGEFYDFLCHTLTRHCISSAWNTGREAKKKIYSFLDAPRVKLYIHMIMYVISYLMLAYYALQQMETASGILKWVLFIMILSLFVDEMRQALGEKQLTIQLSLTLWQSDGWNRLDLLSILVYFVAFTLEWAGFRHSAHRMFSAFSFIWCLKFYQFLRAFEALGTYIILVQKMLPQLGYFAIVAGVAIISYGVFMTSMLFPDIEFKNWNIFIMVLLRPYLLLFAETGINQYRLSAKNTIYNTPKIPTASEIVIVIGMCLFLMFGGVLLLNLLIAIFSGIYEDVKETSEKLWALNDSQLLQEFQKKPIVPIPFSLPINLYHIFKRLSTKVEHFLISDEDHAKLIAVRNALSSSVTKCMEEKKTNDAAIHCIDARVADIQSSLNHFEADVRRLDEHIDTKIKDLQSVMERLGNDGKIGQVRNKESDKRIRNLEMQNKEISMLLRNLIESKKHSVCDILSFRC